VARKIRAPRAGARNLFPRVSRQYFFNTPLNFSGCFRCAPPAQKFFCLTSLPRALIDGRAAEMKTFLPREKAARLFMRERHSGR